MVDPRIHARMLERLHPFPSLGLFLVLAAPLFLFAGEPSIAVVLLLLAHAFTLLEFRKYTSNFQFVMLLVTATTLGMVLDLTYSAWPLLTLAGLLAASAIIARQAFMHRFTYVNMLWADTGLAALSLILYIIAVRTSSFHWDLWLAPLLPISVAVGLTFSYVQDARHIKAQARRGYRVQLGAKAPEFELPDQEGNTVRLSELVGRHPLLLIFVRGDWCPGCHMMLRTYERKRARFLEKGIHVVAIGPDNIEVNKDMVRRIGVSYKMLSDSEQRVSGQYGVVYNNPLVELGVDYAEGIPLPASFLLDANGIVRYVSRPDRVGEFLDPELIFGVLDRIPANGQVAWS